MSTVIEPGWSLLLLGWAGPLEQFDPIVAWYANPALIWCLWRLTMRKELSAKTLIALTAAAIMGAMLAFSGLRPTHIEYGDDHGVNGESYPLIGAYVWLASFAPILVAIGIESIRRILFADTVAPTLEAPPPTTSTTQAGQTLAIKQDVVGVVLLLTAAAALVALAMFLWKSFG